MAAIHVGMSGWTFEGWRGGFYPKGLVQKKELEYASRRVTSIEVNGTFYSLQKPPTFQRWHDETPDGFCFSIKAPQYITHVRRLKDVADPLANFFASGLFCLRRKLGPILWQFPPNVALKDDRFETFLEQLPHDAKEALKIAKKCTDKMIGRSFLEIEGNYPIRHAFEFRHPSFMNPDFISLLRKHGVAIVFAHSGLKSPYMEDVTADFVYARMHGQEELYKNGYPKKVLSWWADRVTCWSKGQEPVDPLTVTTASKTKAKARDAYIYFDTEAKEHAPQDALRFMDLMKINVGHETKTA